ncbi:MAG: hypothetical protein JXJ22_05080 [Bacteroidales bacterium]|nr:hypothetical protein [Bacteroidales bacterium]
MDLTPCFFNPNFLADGKPVICNLHTIHGIKGGTGPMGSVSSSLKKILIPRSKISQKAHAIGRMIKIITLVITLVYLFYGVKQGVNFYILFTFVVGIFLIGSGFCYLFYYYLGIKSKYFSIKKYPEVALLLKKGYKLGFHPIISTTPFGLLYSFSKLIL